MGSVFLQDNKWKLQHTVSFSNYQDLADSWDFDIGNNLPEFRLRDNEGYTEGWGNNEKQYYRDSSCNAFVRGNKLVIKAKRQEFGNCAFTSARMTYKREICYGRIDVRAKVPCGDAIWPAIWLLPQMGKWPDCGEIDIMELRGQFPRYIEGAVHWLADDNQSFAKFPTSTHHFNENVRKLDRGSFSDAFHTYSITWNEQEIRWFVDNRQYLKFNNNSSLPFNKHFQLILNVAVGGNFLCPPNDLQEKLDNTDFNVPREMVVEYIKFFDERKP